MKKIAIYLLYLFYSTAVWSQFAPGANTEGTTAIAKDSNIFINWGHNLIHFSPGPENISDPQSPLASFGDPLNALDIAEGNSYDVVSLGDGGTIT
ncbi:MAG: T9SS C-terminal target domain-containing protein, partial [Putridiphycobacter sp.]|nr:T9SS C-terminal target domain-containing protein [Putridiphycobacter sp.]